MNVWTFTIIDLYETIVSNFLSVAIVNSSMQSRFLTNRCCMILLTTCISELWFSIQNERNKYSLIAKFSLIMIEKVLCKSISFVSTLEACAFDFDFDELLKAEREAEILDLKNVENLEEALNMWKVLMISDCSLSFDTFCNILDMRICNGNRSPFVLSGSSLHNWLTNKNKSCKDSIRNNYDNNYISWSLRNLLSVILSTYIDLNYSILKRSTALTDSSNWQFRICRFTSIVDLSRLCVIYRFDLDSRS